MKHLLILAPVALAACNSGPKVEATNATAKEVADKVEATGAAQRMSPGRWEATATITGVEVPGMPAAMAEKMKAETRKTQTFTDCLTPEEASKPAADFFSGGAQGCVYDRFSMANGVLDAAMTCKSRGPATTHATMKGDFSSDSVQLAMTTRTGTPGQSRSSMTMSMTIEARRVGECTGEEQS